MEFSIKNIILYDSWQHVSGFVELKITPGKTQIKVRHNFNEKHLLLSIAANGEQSNITALDNLQTVFEINKEINLACEVFACIMKRNDNELQTLASGVINLGKGVGLDRGFANKNQESANEAQGISKQNAVKQQTIKQETSKKETAEKENSEQVSAKEFVREESSEVQPDSQIAAFEAKNEVDNILRAVCSIDENGKGQCETCPYREHFYEFNAEHKARTEPITIAGQTTGLFFDAVKKAEDKTNS